jgi:hypothetical protein
MTTLEIIEAIKTLNDVKSNITTISPQEKKLYEELINKLLYFISKL